MGNQEEDVKMADREEYVRVIQKKTGEKNKLGDREEDGNQNEDGSLDNIGDWEEERLENICSRD